MYSGPCPTAKATFAGHAPGELRLPKPATGWPNRRVLPADRSAGKSGHQLHVRLPHVNGRKDRSDRRMDTGDNRKGTDSDNPGDSGSDNPGDSGSDNHKGTDSDNPGDSGLDNH